MVIQYPHPLLRKKIIYDPTLDDQEVIAALFAAVKEEEEFHAVELIGIAANQIGIETRIILYRRVEFGGHDPQLVPLIDPVIDHYGWSELVEVEACGSLPNYQVPVSRHKWIKVSAKNKPATWYMDWDSRIIQHEVDHLDGILIMDREYYE